MSTEEEPIRKYQRVPHTIECDRIGPGKWDCHPECPYLAHRKAQLAESQARYYQRNHSTIRARQKKYRENLSARLDSTKNESIH